MNALTINSPLVSVSWLEENIDASNLIVVNGTIPKVNNDGFDDNRNQIFGARFFDIKKKFSDTSAEFPNTFPSEKQFTAEAQLLGINNDSAIVVYDDLGIYSSARVWWLFKSFEFNNIAVLDGGLPAWGKANFSIEEKKNNVIVRGNFIAKYQSQCMIFFEEINKVAQDENHTIVDARSANRFNGIVAEPRKGLRSGTIPNSKNLPFTELFSDGLFKSKDKLYAIFSKLIEKNSLTTFSCGSGITACVLALGAELSGFKNTSVYDGSWTEYGSLTTKNMEQLHWTKEELVAYILLYTAHANFDEANLEKNVIISKVDMQTFQKIHDEFDDDNDYQSLQKIIEGVKQHNYNSDDLKSLFIDIKILFLSDGDYDVLERNMFSYLKKILS